MFEERIILNLRPMNVGEILDQIFKLYFGQFKSYVAIVVLGLAPMIVLMIFWAFMGLNFISHITAGGMTGGMYALFNPVLIVILAVLYIASLVISLAMYGAIIFKISAQINEQEVKIREAYRSGFRKAWRLFLGALLFGLTSMIGFILLIAPGIYLATSFSLYMQAIIIEDAGPVSALKRSMHLIRGRWWQTFFIMFLVMILLYVVEAVGSLISIPLLLLSMVVLKNPVAAQLINLAVTVPLMILLAPFFMIAYTLIYYDLRIRKENLDLQLMVGSLTSNNIETLGEQI
jgi:hypothetical protein